jgi:hypothetical protein
MMRWEKRPGKSFLYPFTFCGVTVTTASDGTLDPNLQLTPQAHTEYRLRHPATPFYAASTSSTSATDL